MEKKYGKFDFCRTMKLLTHFEEIMKSARGCKLWSYKLSEDKRKMIISPFTIKDLDPDGDFISSQNEIETEDFFTVFSVEIN